MPPKKDKKKAKPKAKRIRMAAAVAPPKFATGFNRQIPGGIIGTGGGGGMNAPGLTPASFLGASLAKQVTQATPIQTPDQFNIIQEQRKQGKVLEEIAEEQKKRGRKTDDELAIIQNRTKEEIKAQRAAEKAAKKLASTPITSMTMTEQLREETIPMRMAPPTEEPPETPDARIGKVGKPKKSKKQSTEMAQPEFGSPPVIGSPEFPGGVNMIQQGMFMGVPSSLRGAPPDGSTSLVGLDPIGEPDVFLG